MKKDKTTIYIDRIDNLLGTIQTVQNFSAIDEVFLGTLTLVNAIYGPNSSHQNMLIENSKTTAHVGSVGYSRHNARFRQVLRGCLSNMRDEIEAGLTQSIRELIHGDLFSDFIEMSEHLLNEGYKDAAAVIAGSTLEAHLRQLCIKYEVDIEYEHNGDIKPKKADKINSDLTKAEVYSRGDQKNVAAWLDFRINAAHGHYEEYTDEQVAIIITAIRDFITRNPA
ncbi:MAG: hypothetical protein WBB48_13500 [Thermodesulfobacteriota bacterium]